MAPAGTGREALAATIRAVVFGDRDAFARLYADYVRLVHAILLGRVPRRDVDDLVQEVFITAYQRIRELRDPTAFGGWIATIARNRAATTRPSGIPDRFRDAGKSPSHLAGRRRSP